MIWRILGLLGLTGALLATGAFFYSAEISRLLAGEAYRFEAVTPQVAAEGGQEFSIRLIGPDGAPVGNADINGVRLDMSPDGMAAMASPVTKAPPGAPAPSPIGPTSPWLVAGPCMSRRRCRDRPHPSPARSF